MAIIRSRAKNKAKKQLKFLVKTSISELTVKCKTQKTEGGERLQKQSVKNIKVYQQNDDIRIKAMENHPTQTKGIDARGKQIIHGGIRLWL